jgi:hypothetical protein
MANAVTTTSPLFSVPYLTIAEYKQAPTAVDVDDLVGGGTQAINNQELANVVARASSWIDSYCGQVLGATTDTEAMRARVDRNGFLTIHPRFFPIVEVVSLSYGVLPNSIAPIDVSTVWIENQSIVVPLTGINMAFSNGPIQFNGNYSTTQESFVSVKYVNGYANTVLTSNVSASATSIPVSDLAAFLPGGQFAIYDGSNTELLNVASTFTPTSGAGSLPISTQLAYAHTNGISVSTLPPAIKQAAIYVTSAILKARGNAALVMGNITPGAVQNANPGANNDLMAAWDILKPYRRIR